MSYYRHDSDGKRAVRDLQKVCGTNEVITNALLPVPNVGIHTQKKKSKKKIYAEINIPYQCITRPTFNSKT